jgi:hypothetical protein
MADSFASREEWALMYRQGLRPAQIAELCSVPAQQVRRSIGQRKRIDPLLEAAHLNNAPKPPPPSKLTAAWLARLAEFTAFLGEEGRLPRQQAGDAREKSLGAWLRLQRTAHGQGKLDDRQIEALNEAGEWQISARAQADEARWQARLKQLGEFAAANGRMPSFRNRDDETERRLGTWLHVQRQKAVNGKLPEKHRQQLDEAVPGWNTWRSNAAE